MRKKTQRQKSDRKRETEIGQRIRTRRIDLAFSQKMLAVVVGCKQSQISGFETGKKPPGALYLRLLAQHLLCSVIYLTTGQAGSTGGISPCEKKPSEPHTIETELVEELGRVLGEAFNVRASRVHASYLPAVLAVCEGFLPRIFQWFFTGGERHSLDRALRIIVCLARRGYYEQDVPSARQLLFDAIDAHVLCDLFLVPGSELKAATQQHLSEMACLLAEGSRDAGRHERFCARLGEVLRLSPSKDAVSHMRALRLLQYSRKLGGTRLEAGYHAVRSVPILAARCENMSAADFDSIVAVSKTDLQTDSLMPHDKTFIVDGFAEAYALRYKGSRQPLAKKEALRNLEWAQELSRTPTGRDGLHVLCSLRIEKLPVVLAQAGIFDHYGSAGAGLGNEIQENALRVLRRANEIGCERTVEQMSKVLAKPSKSWDVTVGRN